MAIHHHAPGIGFDAACARQIPAIANIEQVQLDLRVFCEPHILESVANIGIKRLVARDGFIVHER